jgi:hypothetical protein
MKFWKWFAFTSEGSSEEQVREEYRKLPDRYLAQLDPSTLTAVGLKIYREEVSRRKTPPAATLANSGLSR